MTVLRVFVAGTAAAVSTGLFACTNKSPTPQSAGLSSQLPAQPGHPPQLPPGVPQPPLQIPAPPDLNEPPADAVKKPSGLVTKMLQPGTGTTKPEDHDIVAVRFTGWTKDGKMFATSVGHPRHAVFPVGKIFLGWSEALKEMVQGEKRRLWIPQSLAFAGRPGSPTGDLVIDSELVAITAGPRAVIKTTAGELLAAYESNEVRADGEYKGKIVEVTGIVGAVRDTTLGGISVDLGTGKRWELQSVTCYVSRDQAEHVAKLNKGDRAKVRDTVKGLRMNVLLKDCRLISYGG